MLAGLLFVSLLSVAALYGRFFFFPGTSQSVRAVITSEGKLVRTVSLSPGERSSFHVHGRAGSSTVEIEGTRIRMLDAPCIGRVCVKQGWIEHPGQTIVCVPGEILVRIEGAAPVDAVTR
jgi:hypothetical protein